MEESSVPRITPCARFLRIIRHWIYIQSGIPEHYILKLFLNLIFIVFGWGLLFCIFEEHAEIKIQLLYLMTLTLISYIVGVIFGFMRLPPLLGQLITGVTLRSVGFVNMGDIYLFLVPVIRKCAMATILLKAGLGLELHSLIQLKWTIIKLTVLPCIGEAFAAGLIAYFFVGCSWTWGLLIGFLLSSISPAIVIPLLLSLKEQGYGEDKGISTMVIAASGLDDILSISCFSICYSLIFYPSDSLVYAVIRGPLEFVIGCCTGILWGLFCALIPHRSDGYRTVKRSILIGAGGILSVFASEELGVESSGPLFCMISAFIASLSWQIQEKEETQPLDESEEEVSEIYKIVWSALEPFLFSMIGAEIDVIALGGTEVLQSVVIISGALAFRAFVCTLALFGTDLNVKEKVFVNLAWVPKATVQAAIGPLPLDHMRKIHQDPESEEYHFGVLALTVAVLSILITAPLGSISIQLTGPVLLSKGQKLSKKSRGTIDKFEDKKNLMPPISSNEEKQDKITKGSGAVSPSPPSASVTSSHR